MRGEYIPDRRVTLLNKKPAKHLTGFTICKHAI